MRLFKDQLGSAHLVLIALVTVVILGGLAYFTYNKISNNTEKTDTTEPSAKILESKSDVSQAKSDVDSLSADEDLDPSQLDADLNQL